MFEANDILLLGTLRGCSMSIMYVVVCQRMYVVQFQWRSRARRMGNSRSLIIIGFGWCMTANILIRLYLDLGTNEMLLKCRLSVYLVYLCAWMNLWSRVYALLDIQAHVWQEMWAIVSLAPYVALQKPIGIVVYSKQTKISGARITTTS